MLTVKGNVDILASWTAFFNCGTIIWVIGAGLSATARNDVGYSIGQGKKMVAKKYAKMAIVLALCCSFFWGILIDIFHNEIATWFSDVEGVLEY